MVELKLNLSNFQIDPKCKSLQVDVIPRPEVMIEEN